MLIQLMLLTMQNLKSWSICGRIRHLKPEQFTSTTIVLKEEKRKHVEKNTICCENIGMWTRNNIV